MCSVETSKPDAGTLITAHDGLLGVRPIGREHTRIFSVMAPSPFRVLGFSRVVGARNINAPRSPIKTNALELPRRCECQRTDIRTLLPNLLEGHPLLKSISLSRRRRRDSLRANPTSPSRPSAASSLLLLVLSPDPTSASPICFSHACFITSHEHSLPHTSMLVEAPFF